MFGTLSTLGCYIGRWKCVLHDQTAIKASRQIEEETDWKLHSLELEDISLNHAGSANDHRIYSTYQYAYVFGAPSAKTGHKVALWHHGYVWYSEGRPDG